MLSAELAGATWIKNWSVNVGATFCSFYGDLYETEFPKHLGTGYQNTLYTFENGTSNQYLLADEQKAVIAHIVAQIEKDHAVGKAYCQNVREQTDRIMALMDRLQAKQADDLSLDDFSQLRESLFSHVPPNYVVKRTADFLSQATLEILFEDLEKARLYTEPVYGRVEQTIRLFARKIALRTDMDEEVLRSLTDAETVEYFTSQRLPSVTELQNRSKGMALHYQKGNSVMYTGAKFESIKAALHKPEEQGVVKGKMAFPGRVSGIVRIIFDPHRFKVFEKGDILVTGMTRPEFVPLMEKAGAFVTDAGGILSHAAIIARELKKPCVVGTLNATQVLKEGDTVEVDAEKGLVHVIKRA